MTPNAVSCPRCSSPMEEGFLIDKDHSGVRPGRWLAGPPEASLWQGMKTSGKACFLAATYRCTGCGFLESYATVPADPPSFFIP